MATAKKKKMIGWIIFLAIVGFFVRPIRANYVNKNGTPQGAALVKRTGLFSVQFLPTPGTTGAIGLFGSVITWSDGDVWKAV
jgi:hypothetical protein